MAGGDFDRATITSLDEQATKDPKQAEETLRFILESNPDDPEIHRLLSLSLGAQGKYSELLDHSHDVVLANPENEEYANIYLAAVKFVADNGQTDLLVQQKDKFENSDIDHVRLDNALNIFTDPSNSYTSDNTLG